jgi:hypothetical protein
MRVLLSVVAGIGLLAGPLVAQTPRGPVPVRVGLTAASGELRTSNSATLELRRQVAADTVRETQWVKGGVIGGLMLGAAMGYFFYSFQKIDDFPDTAAPLIGGLVIGGALGFVIGALIGGQFEK